MPKEESEGLSGKLSKEKVGRSADSNSVAEEWGGLSDSVSPVGSSALDVVGAKNAPDPTTVKSDSYYSNMHPSLRREYDKRVAILKRIFNGTYEKKTLKDVTYAEAKQLRGLYGDYLEDVIHERRRVSSVIDLLKDIEELTKPDVVPKFIDGDKQ